MDKQIFDSDMFFEATSIYANEFIITINTLSGNGILIRDDKGKEYLLAGNVDNTQIGQALLDCLSASRRVLPVNDMELYDYKQGAESYNKWVSRLQGFVGFNSKAKLFRPMFSITVIEQNGTIFLQPSRQVKPEAWSGQGIEESDHVQIPTASSHEEIGEAVRLVLSRCESVFVK